MQSKNLLKLCTINKNSKETRGQQKRIQSFMGVHIESMTVKKEMTEKEYWRLSQSLKNLDQPKGWYHGP